MKAFLAAVAAMVVITVAAPFILQQIGFSAADAGSGCGGAARLNVRISDNQRTGRPAAHWRA